MDAAQLRPPVPNGIALPTTMQPRDFSPSESLTWLEQFALALNQTGRLAVSAATTRNADGTLTILITPHSS
jgi:hypothetical protein